MKGINILFSWLFLTLAINVGIQAQSQSQSQSSFEVESFSVNIVGAGRDIILIPGLLSDERVWDEVIEPLSAQYRLHLVSLAGFSGNQPMSEPSLLKVKQDLLTYIKFNKLNQPVVVGHSVGGFMAMWMAIEVESNIGPIISIDGLPFYSTTITSDSKTQASDMVEQAQQIFDFYSTLSSEQILQMSQQGMYVQTVKPNNVEKITDMIRNSDGATTANAMATLMTTDLRLELSNITQPLLLLGAGGLAFGTIYESTMIEIYKQQLEAKPKAQLEINWNSGHFITFDEPQWVLDQIQIFLEQL